MTAKTYAGSVRDFIRSNSWLTDEHSPAVVILETLAAELDEKISPAMVAQFGLTYRDLLKQKPKGPGETDPVDEIFDEARS